MYSRFRIQTQLSTVEAEDTLARLVDARRGSAAKPFVGRVEGGAFKFHRAFIGRNSFMPIVSGRIVQGEGGAVLQGTMRLPWAVAVFMACSVWTAIVAVVSTLSKPLADSDTFAVFFAVVFPVFVIILMFVGYLPERRKAMRLLVTAFAAVGVLLRRPETE